MASYITNGKLYIRLTTHGHPVPCLLSKAKVFDDDKAKNTLRSLPNELKQFGFKIERTKSSCADNKKSEKDCNQKILRSKKEPNDNVERWIETITEISEQAIIRREQLSEELSKADGKLCDIYHEIELENTLNACDGYKQYREIKNILEQRRKIKDELMIVSAISANRFREPVMNEASKINGRVYHYRADYGGII